MTALKPTGSGTWFTCPIWVGRSRSSGSKVCEGGLLASAKFPRHDVVLGRVISKSGEESLLPLSALGVQFQKTQLKRPEEEQ